VRLLLLGREPVGGDTTGPPSFGLSSSFFTERTLQSSWCVCTGEDAGEGTGERRPGSESRTLLGAGGWSAGFNPPHDPRRCRMLRVETVGLRTFFSKPGGTVTFLPMRAPLVESCSRGPGAAAALPVDNFGRSLAAAAAAGGG
jgi:hypothetical protein